jgi:putative addiction module component (TIGR02574 family)
MSHQALARVRDEAMELPQPERAELAYALVTSLDGPVDDQVSEAWETEIAARLHEVETGSAKLIDRQNFDRRMKERLRQL